MTVPIKVMSNASIGQVKIILENTPEIGVPPQHQRLIFGGSELPDEHRLNDRTRPISEGCTLLIALRTNQPAPNMPLQMPVFNAALARQPSMFMQGRAPAPMQPYPVAVPVRPMMNPFVNPPPAGANNAMMELASFADYQQVGMAIERHAAHLRLFGVFFVTMGAFLVIMGGVNVTWTNLTIGFVLVLLGVTSIWASVTKSSRAAKALAFLMFIALLVFVGVYVSDAVTNPSERYSLAVGIVVAVLTPLILCSFCVWFARKYMQRCSRRDELLSLNPALRGMPLVM